MARFRERELAVCAWTVNDSARARDLAAMGVAAITTDDVPAITAALGPG